MRATLFIGALAFVGCMFSAEPSAALWRLWSQSTPPESREPQTSKALEALRERGCAVGDPIRRFGENAYMRKEASKQELSTDAQRRLAAAYAANDETVAAELLAPTLVSPSPSERMTARIALAFAAMRQKGPTTAARASVRALLSSDATFDASADAQYLLAAAAMAGGDWQEAEARAERALALSPEMYNAQMIWSLAKLRAAARDVAGGSCTRAVDAMEAALTPLLQLGACSTHVGHIELAARRYLGGGEVEARASLLRAAILAYVARADAALDRSLDNYLASFGADACLQAVRRRLGQAK